MLTGGGNVGYCGLSGCHIAASSGFNFPNGMIKGKDGLYYIPSSLIDKIRVMKLQPDLTLKETDVIHLGMPVDNLSLDKSSGDIYASAFPKMIVTLKTFGKPYELDSPTTIWRIRKSASGYETMKVLEDKEVKIVGGATVVVHDSKTGRLFIGGKFSRQFFRQKRLIMARCRCSLYFGLRPQVA